MPYLVFSKNGPADPVQLSDKPLVLGRGADADLRLQDNQLSRRHCKFSSTPTGFLIEDLASANGTTVNGAKISGQVKLSPGDKVTIGGVEMIFSLEPPKTAERPASSASTSGTSIAKPVSDSSANHPTIKASGVGQPTPTSADAASSSATPPKPTGPYLKLHHAPDGLELPPTFALNGELLTLGRKPGNSIVIKASVVSGQHLEFRHSGGQWSLKDLGSTNGVKVNGVKVAESPLNVGDLIAIEQLVFQFLDASKEPPALATAQRLRVVDGDIGTSHIVLGGTPITFGRKPGNTYPIKDTELSGNHVKIQRDDQGKVVVVDLDSTNGTRVDNRKLEPNKPCPLTPGSIIKFGRVVLVFEDPSAPTSQTPSGRTAIKSAKPNQNDTLDDDVKLDVDLNLGDAPATASVKQKVAAALAQGPISDMDDEKAKAQMQTETQEFLAAKEPTRKNRRLLWIMAEVTLLAAIAAVGAWALISAQAVVVEKTTTGPQTLNPPPESLIKTNWSFEDDEGGLDAGRGFGVLPKGWDLQGGNDDGFARSSAAPKAGQMCLEIQRGSNDYGSTDAYSQDVISTKPGDKLEVRAAVRRVDGNSGGGGLKVVFFRDKDAREYVTTALSDFTTSSEWVDLVLTVEVPITVVSARIACSVIGRDVKLAFDNVEAYVKPAERGATVPGVQTLKSGDLEWRIGLDGLIHLMRQTADRQEWILRDGEFTFQMSAAQTSAARVSDLTRARRFRNPEPGKLAMSATLLEPFAPPVGAKVATNVVDITLGFSAAGHPTLNVSFSRETPVSDISWLVGLVGISNGERIARFASPRMGSQKQILMFHALPLRGSDGKPLRAHRLVFPRDPDGHLSIAVMEGLEALADAEISQRDLSLKLRLRGTRATFELRINPFAQEIADLQRQATELAVASKFGAALAAHLNALRLSLHSRHGIAECAEAIGMITSKLRYQIDEYTDNMESLRLNFSRDRFMRTQAQALDLIASIGVADLAAAPRDFLDAHGPDGRPGDPISRDEAGYLDYFTRVKRDLDLLDSVPANFKKLSEERRADVDAATLIRSEDAIRPLLSRGLDYEMAGLTNMAIATYREVLKGAPLSRPATVARKQVVKIAEKLMALGDEQIGKGLRQLGTDNRNLAKTLAAEVLADAFEDTRFWDAQAPDPEMIGAVGNWSMPRASVFVRNFYTIEGDPSLTPEQPDKLPAWKRTWPTADKWWRWNSTQWRKAERDARTLATAIVAK